MKHILVLLSLFCSFFATFPAHAQRFELQGVYQRIGRLENDMGLLQRQAAAGGMGGAAAPAGNVGQISADIMRMDEEMRSLRGELERLSYQNEQNAKQLQKFQEDMEFRLQELETKSISSPMATAPMMPSAEEQAAAAATSSAPAIAKREDLTEELTAVVRNQEAGEATTTPPAPANARDLYNSAFKQLNQTNYKGAETSFKQFTQQYPNDPLIGNAWYWLGEAYYVQRDYTKAADSFRQGYTKLPDGPKAGDNLMKLGMTLAALKKNPEACVVLKQTDKKFSANSEAIKTKARQEISRLACK